MHGETPKGNLDWLKYNVDQLGVTDKVMKFAESKRRDDGHTEGQGDKNIDDAYETKDSCTDCGTVGTKEKMQTDGVHKNVVEVPTTEPAK